MNKSGDHSTVFTPEGLEVQECLRTYKDDHVVEAEHEWIQDYIKGEMESNEDLINEDGTLVNHVYTLHKVYLHDVKVTRKDVKTGFSTFLYRAITAKANIGK